MSDDLKGLEFTQIDSTWLRRYAAPIKIVGPMEGGIFTAGFKLEKGKCQIVGGFGIYPNTITDEEIDKEFSDAIMMKKSELIRFLNANYKKR